jgi:putative copper resistance protein D
MTGPRRAAVTAAFDGAAVIRWAAGTALVSAAVLVVVLLAGGGAPQPVPAGLPDAGAVTGWGLPAVTLLAMLAGLATVGLLLAAALLLPSPTDRLADVSARGASLAAGVAWVWLVSVLVEMVLTVSDVLGVPPGQVMDPVVLRSFLGQTSQGRALLVQAGLVVLVAGLARSARSTRGGLVATVVALGALVPPALTGHSAASGSHELAVASLLVHLLAVGLWVGGLAALAWSAVAGTDGLRYAVPRFSCLAAWCFVAVAVSGAVNAGVRLGGLEPLVSSAYGALVLAKVAALGVLGGFGWWHRRNTVDRLAAGGPSVDQRRAAVGAFVSVAAAELVVMAATVALAVGLSRTPTPVGDAGFVSPAADVLGFPLPPAPTAARFAFGFAPDGFALTFVVLAAALYGTGVWVLRRRGDRWPPGRTMCWVGGLLVFTWATCGGLGLYSHVLFSAHMVAHMLLSMVAPIGLVLGAPVTLALRTLPGPRVRGESSPRGLLTAALHSRAVKVLTHPLVALALFVGSLYALYFTALFPTLMGNHLGHVAMEFHFLAVGSLFFYVLVGLDPTPWRLPPIARVGLLFAAMPFHAFFSVALMSSSTAIASGYYRSLNRPYRTDLLADQHLGGSIGWVMGELPIVLVLAAVVVQWVRSDGREARRYDRRADRAEQETRSRARAGAAGPAPHDELAHYNAHLAALHARDRHAPPAPEQHEGPRS